MGSSQVSGCQSPARRAERTQWNAARSISADHQHRRLAAGGQPLAGLAIIDQRGAAGDPQHLVGGRPHQHQADARLGEDVAQPQRQLVALPLWNQQGLAIDDLDEAGIIALRAQLQAPTSDRAENQERAAPDELHALVAQAIAQLGAGARAGFRDDLAQPRQRRDLRHDLSCPPI